MKFQSQLSIVGAFVVLIAVCAVAGSFLPGINQTVYHRTDLAVYNQEKIAAVGQSVPDPVTAATSSQATSSVASHIPTPTSIRAIYLTSWVAGTPSMRDPLISLIESSNLNAVVIDIKDETGYLSFIPNSPTLRAMGTYQNRIANIDALIARLHAAGIYVIGRVNVFEDPLMVKQHPQWAVQYGKYMLNAAGKRVLTPANLVGTPWKDAHGNTWLDPSATGDWGYFVDIAKEAYSRGFDEINFDYMRFPSDGDVANAVFPISGSTPAPIVLTNVYQYLYKNLHNYRGPSGQSGPGLKISQDLFGQTTTTSGDMGIGEVLEDALPYFNYVDVELYPSHFINGWGGFYPPDKYPYQVVQETMHSAVERAKLLAAGSMATTTMYGVPRTKTVIDSILNIPLADRLRASPAELRPWIQDFTLHGISYTPAMLDDEMRAVQSVGLSSWLIWDPSNKYTATKQLLAGKQ